METLSLAGTWTLSHNAGAMSLPMAVPGDILSALVESGLAPDPYIGTNEASVQWVGKTDWTIERDFTLSASFVSLPRIFLDIEVLDTIAEVRINNSLAGRSDNMFVRFRRDVAQLLHPGENHIAITIYSPEKAAAERADRLPYAIPESTYPVSSPHRNLLRKVQCMAGWDWGPCLMTGGIYDGIALTATDGPRIDYLRTRIKPAGSDFSVSVCAEVNVLEAMDLDLSFSLAGQKTSCRQKVPKGDSTISREIVVRDPEFWWPNEMGEQALYELVASAEAVKPGSALAPHVLRKKIGFRELRVSTEEDAIGREMKIVVNGHDVFAKGANWIPADALPSRWTDSRIEGLLRSAAAVHINCLRVWGGGRYESDAFYELCDRLGIMVWQDCMFSCALYPSAPDFLESVEKEIRHQVKRLADHPSLALWCGNNEALGAITWYEESRKSPARYIVDYDRLTEGVLGRTIRELDPDRCWWPSSPSAGPKDFSDNWHSDERGDMHFWSVWHEGKAFSEYLTVKPRFCSEFGFQSFPSHRTIEGFAPPDERNISSPAMEAHQRHPRGNSLIVDTILRYFRMPKGFRETLYLSQVQQAMAIKTAVEFWRSNRPRCMGALYWQLNDVWPVTSWSSLEYDGSWKLLHYEANRFYDPLLLALFTHEGKIELRAVNDGFSGFEGSFAVSFINFKGETIESHRGTSILAAESASPLWSIPLASAPEAVDRCFVEATLTAKSLPQGEKEAAAEKVVRRARLFLTEPKRCRLESAGIAVRAEWDVATDGKDQLYAVVTATEAPAFYVVLENEDSAGRFEDAGFHLAKGESRRLRYIPEAHGKNNPTIPAVSAPRIVAYDLRSSFI